MYQLGNYLSNHHYVMGLTIKKGKSKRCLNVYAQLISYNYQDKF